MTISCTAFTCYLRVPCDERGPHYTLHYVVAWNGLGLGKKNRTTLGGLELANFAIGTYTSNKRLDDLLDNYHLWANDIHWTQCYSLWHEGHVYILKSGRKLEWVL